LFVVVPPAGVKDVTWSAFGDILLPHSTLDLFQKHRVTGFEVRRANVSRRRPPELFELIVTGWGGFAAADARVSVVEFCPICGHRCYAITEPSRLIDPTGWDGSDFFMVWPLPRFRFVSDRLANILREEGVSGVALSPPSEIELLTGEASPGTLARCMPERRAAELEQRYEVSNWRGNTGLRNRISRWWASRS
jgi:hypothetical protein